MLKFIKKIALLVLPLFILALVLDYFVTTGLKKTSYGNFAEWNGIFNGEINADILINGSSRAVRHFATHILDSSLHTNSYNLGMMGYYFGMQYNRWDLYKKNNSKPRLLIQAVGMRELCKREDLFEYEQFFPYYDNKKVIQLIRGYDGFSYTDKYFPFIRYLKKKELIQIGINETFGLKQYSSQKLKGYLPLNEKWKNDFASFRKLHPQGCYIDEFDDLSLQNFNHFIAGCVAEEQNLIIVCPPEYIEMQQITLNRDSTSQFIKKKCQQYGVIFLDYSSHPISYDTSYFFNSQHLNKDGAEVFTRALIEDLNSLGILNQNITQ